MCVCVCKGKFRETDWMDMLVEDIDEFDKETEIKTKLQIERDNIIKRIQQETYVEIDRYVKIDRYSYIDK